MKNAGMLVIVALAAIACTGCVMSAADRADLIETSARLAGDRAAQAAEKAAKVFIEAAIAEATKKAADLGLPPAEVEKLLAAATEKANAAAAKLVEEARAKAETAARELASRSVKESEDGKANVFGKILLAITGLLGAGGVLATKAVGGGA